MAAAPLHSEVGFYYDCDGGALRPGDVLSTPRGRCYLVLRTRVQQRGKHVGRHHLRALVIEAPPAGARIFSLHWYPRSG